MEGGVGDIENGAVLTFRECWRGILDDTGGEEMKESRLAISKSILSGGELIIFEVDLVYHQTTCCQR